MEMIKINPHQETSGQPETYAMKCITGQQMEKKL